MRLRLRHRAADDERLLAILAEHFEEQRQEALEELTRLYLERHGNVVGEELAEDFVLDLLEAPATNLLVETALPELRGLVRFELVAER